MGLCKYSLFSTSDARLRIDVERGPTKPYGFPGTLLGRLEIVLQEHLNDPAVKDGYGNILNFS